MIWFSKSVGVSMADFNWVHLLELCAWVQRWSSDMRTCVQTFYDCCSQTGELTNEVFTGPDTEKHFFTSAVVIAMKNRDMMFLFSYILQCKVTQTRKTMPSVKKKKTQAVVSVITEECLPWLENSKHTLKKILWWRGLYRLLNEPSQQEVDSSCWPAHYEKTH